jgi:hypothetical protein
MKQHNPTMQPITPLAPQAPEILITPPKPECQDEPTMQKQ